MSLEAEFKSGGAGGLDRGKIRYFPVKMPGQPVDLPGLPSVVPDVLYPNVTYEHGPVPRPK